MFSQNPGHWPHYLATINMALSAPSPERRALYPDGDWMRDNGGGGVTELLNKDQLIATAKSSDSWVYRGFGVLNLFGCVKDILLFYFTIINKLLNWSFSLFFLFLTWESNSNSHHNYSEVKRALMVLSVPVSSDSTLMRPSACFLSPGISHFATA